MCFLSFILYMTQAKTMEVYPCPQTSIALMSIMGTIQCVVFGFIVERDLNQWKLGWDIRLITVAFSVCSSLTSTLLFMMTWFVNLMKMRIMNHKRSNWSLFIWFNVLFAGNFSLRSNDSCHCMGCTDERPFVCVCFQPSNAFDCCFCRFYGVGWEVKFRQVWTISSKSDYI